MVTITRRLLAAALLSAALIPSSASAQKDNASFTFQWGQEYELPKRHEDLGFVGDATNGYVQIGHQKGNNISFQKFDAGLKLVSEQEADIDKLPGDYINEFVGQIGSRYYWFFSTWDRREERESLYAQELDLAGGKLKGRAREICHSTKLAPPADGMGRGLGRLWSSNPEEKWNFFFSFDKSKMLVEYRKKPERRNDALNNDVIGFQVFDSDLNKVWGRETRMPYSEKKMENEDYQVDGQGNVYTLASVINTAPGSSSGYHYEVLRWGKDKPQADKISFNLTDNKFVSSAALSEDRNGTMIVSGYYRTDRGGGGVDGAFILRLDQGELKNVAKGTYEFPTSLLAQYEKARVRRRMARKSKNGDVAADYLALRSVVLQEDGSIQIFGEESWTDVIYNTTSTGTGSTTHSTTYIHHYNDILAMSIGADGELQWAAKVPKEQVARSGSNRDGQGDMSFKAYTYGGNTYFFFIDRESNLNLGPEDAPDAHNDNARGVLVAVKVDGTGKTSKQLVYNGKDEKLRVTPTDFDEVGNNQLIVRGRARRRESQAALITFQ